MPQIENEYLTVSATLKGGELTHVIDRANQQELLYQADGVWPHQDVLMFPIIGKNVPYEVHGKSYTCPMQHGLVRVNELTLVEQTATSMTFCLSSNPQTLSEYPYAFRFFVTYRLDGKRLIRSFRIENLNDEDMPFQLGDHAGYQAKFGKAVLHLGHQNLYFYPRRNNIFNGNPISFPTNGDWQFQKEDFKKYETILLERPAQELSLSTGFGYRLTYHFSSPYIAIWSPDAASDFLCVEPWWGMAPYEDRPEAMLDWKDINLGGKVSTFEESISFERE